MESETLKKLKEYLKEALPSGTSEMFLEFSIAFLCQEIDKLKEQKQK